MIFTVSYRSTTDTPNYQNGGALVESILVVGVLLVFMMGVPMIGSMIDLKQTTIQASRYSAWEKTVNVEMNGGAEQIDTRFFKDASAPISTSLNSGLAENLLWGQLPANDAAQTPTADGANTASTEGGLSMAQEARITLGTVSSSNQYAAEGAENPGDTREDSGVIYKNVSRVITTLGSFISPDGWDDGNPLGDGLVKSNVSASIESNSLFAASKTIDESTSIFIDGWAASDNDIIRDRVHGFVPSNRLEKVGEFVSVLKVIPMLEDLEHLENAFGCVKTNVVPGKELGSPLSIYGETPQDNC